MSVYYLTGFFLLLLLVAGYMFLTHSLERRRIRRQRLLTALKARRNTFKDLATGFPKGFLSKDLTGFLYRSLIDACEQLVLLEPQNGQYVEEITLYNAQLSANATSGDDTGRVRIENPGQLKEARTLLQELHKFILQQAKMGLVNPVQAAAYEDQIKRLILQLSVDSHILGARKAQQMGKTRLAIHYFGLARKLLIGEGAGKNFEKQIGQLDGVITKLEEKARAAGELPNEHQPDENDQSGVQKEWDAFNQESESWKKKQIYD